MPSNKYILSINLSRDNVVTTSIITYIIVMLDKGTLKSNTKHETQCLVTCSVLLSSRAIVVYPDKPTLPSSRVLQWSILRQCATCFSFFLAELKLVMLQANQNQLHLECSNYCFVLFLTFFCQWNKKGTLLKVIVYLLHYCIYLECCVLH